MGEKAITGYTYEAYLAMEAESAIKYEYHDGFITAMAGGSLEHGQIAANFIGAASSALKASDKPCIIYSSDVKVHISTTHRTFYPDASVVCGAPERSEKDQHAITNPILLLEVLSEGTVGFDRGAKFAHYRQLTSLREYILISQTEAMVDVYYRTDDGTWDIQTIIGLSEDVHVKSLDCQLKMADIYRLVPGIEEAKSEY